MSDFLSITSKGQTNLNNKQNLNNATNPIQQNENSFFKYTNVSASSYLDEKNATEELNKAQEETNEFNPNDILDEYEITKDDLKYATGEQLLSLYLEADYSSDNDYSKHNAMLVTLLSNATKDQVDDFMKSFEEYSNDSDWSDYKFSFDNLSNQLKKIDGALKYTDKDQYEEFSQILSENSDLFNQDDYSRYYGI